MGATKGPDQSSDSGSVTSTGEVKRETWANKIDFLVACVGFSVGLGNVWRFPYLCFKNGGGAFLVPYFICAAIGGIPLFYLEVVHGQFMSEGGITAWRIVPILQGIGWSTTVIVFFVNCYYNVILCWAFYYLFASFTAELPWTSCNNTWNTELCTTDFTNTSIKRLNGSRFVDPTTEFWERKVLSISDGVGEPGQIKWDLALCLLLAWCLVYFCIWKGIRTSGKVMYVTATAPYLLLLILLIRGALLPGAKQGILYYMVPDFQALTSMGVWVDAGTQVFFSYAVCLGGLTALGSYNKWSHNSYKDSLLFACTNSGTSIFAGFVIFSVLGFMADQQGVSVSEVAESGPGLAFIVYPKAVAQMPVAPLWSIMFFLMLIMLGLDSQFVAVEGFVTVFLDIYPVLRRKGYRECFIALACGVKFLVGLSMVTNGGMYVFQLFDYYSGSRIILIVALFECLAISYIYGIDRFYDNIEMMYGFRINPYMKVCWTFLSPVFCLTIFIMSTVNYSELDYRRPSGIYIYPGWAVAVGWGTAAVCAVWIPLVAGYKVIKYIFIQKKGWKSLIQPEGLRAHQLRPQDIFEMEPKDREEALAMSAATGAHVAVAPVQYAGVPDGVILRHKKDDIKQTNRL